MLMTSTIIETRQHLMMVRSQYLKISIIQFFGTRQIAPGTTKYAPKLEASKQQIPTTKLSTTPYLFASGHNPVETFSISCKNHKKQKSSQQFIIISPSFPYTTVLLETWSMRFRYGGDRPPVTKTVFTVGSSDPWSGIGRKQGNNDTAPLIVIKGY